MTLFLAALMTLSLSFPRGEIVDRVICEEDSSQSYAVYLPSDYTPEKQWPVLLALDPGARGNAPLQVFREAAEEYGYIVVGSNNSRNGPMNPALYAVERMWEDARERFSVDKQRVHLTGFSGGVRVAGRFAQSLPEVKAVIGCGAGFDLDKSTAKVPFTFVGVCGSRDMNYMWLQTLNAELLNRKTSSRLVIFDGEHHWPPAELCREAIQWVELASYREGRLPVNSELVNKLYQSERERAKELEESGDFFRSYLIQLDLRSDFDGLKKLDEVNRSIRNLAGKERLRDSWKKARDLEQEESRYLKEILSEFLDTSRRRETAWWEKKIKNIRNIAVRDPNRAHQLMVKRLIDALWRNGYERAWLATLDQDYETAVYFAEVAVLVMPESSEVLYNLARMYALNQQDPAAIETLRQAIAAGLTNVNRIEEDHAFESLRLLPELAPFLAVGRNSGNEK